MSVMHADKHYVMMQWEGIVKQEISIPICGIKYVASAKVRRFLD